jgi:hypothetical protein
MGEAIDNWSRNETIGMMREDRPSVNEGKGGFKEAGARVAHGKLFTSLSVAPL